MIEDPLHFFVPGRLDRRTGGSIYDRRMIEGLHRFGREVNVVELPDVSPVAGGRFGTELAERLADLRRGSLVVIDFWALAGAPAVARTHFSRLTLVALVHLLGSDDPQLDPGLRRHQRELEDAALQACHGIVATSSTTAERVRDRGIRPDRVRIVIPGTDPAAPAIGPGPGAPAQILCVAAVTPGKGQADLVRALVELTDVPWSCVCAGSLSRSPDYAASVEAAVREAGLSGRVTFAGECDETTVAGLYATSSIFVLPSHYETYGMVLTEAMARGLPIVSTTAGAIPETVPAEAGILVRPGDGRALAGALGSLLGSPPHGPSEASARRARLGVAARRHAADLPRWERQVARFSDSLSWFARTAR